MQDGTLTARSLLLEARSVLEGGGYQLDRDFDVTQSLGDLCFVAEDSFGIVLFVAYDTWTALADGWPNAQAALVKLLSEKLPKGNPKAWEGYLVVVTPSPSGDERAEDEIRYDTFRVRKIIASGESIRYMVDLSDMLMPLLPLNISEAAVLDRSGSVLDRLPEMLAANDIGIGLATALVEAFKKDEPLLESIQASLK
jgi:hypothetical protein